MPDLALPSPPGHAGAPAAAADPPGAVPPLGRVVAWFLLASYAALLVSAARLLAAVDVAGPAAAAFAAAVLVTYAALYLAPVALPALGAAWALDRLGAGRAGRGLLLLLVALGAGAAQTFVVADLTVFRMFGFHLNGFVWNIVRTPGGLESLGGGTATWRSVAATVAWVVAGQVGLLLAVRHLVARAGPWLPRATARRVGLALVALVGLGAAERLGYGAATLWHADRVLAVAGAFPLYLPTTFGHLARRLGVAPDEPEGPRMRAATGLRYPLRPLTRAPGAPRLNVVMLVAESLRADMVDPRVMPRTYAFARGNQWFRNHLSAGNGTRMGLFGLFYGLYGSYWFPFLAERRPPALLDLLRGDGYRFVCQTSAVFTYPEFDQTIFAGVPAEALRIGSLPLGWQRDRAHVDRLLDELDQAGDRPFFMFQFFEATHARYTFPPEAALEPDFVDDLDYTLFADPARVQAEIGRIKARYVNACHFLDAEVGRVLDRLAARGLLDRTLVVITGDHGEEFLEHGRWGHNSAFVGAQLRPPLVLHVPGAAPAERTALTSHLDVAPTLLRALGVTNPPEDYCQGLDLLGPARRRYAVLADWYTVGYDTGRDVAVFPLGLGVGEVLRPEVRHDDVRVDDPAPFLAAHQADLVEVMRGLRTFAAR